MVAYSKRIIRVCTTLLMEVFYKYHLWYVQTDIVAFFMTWIWRLKWDSRVNVRRFCTFRRSSVLLGLNNKRKARESEQRLRLVITGGLPGVEMIVFYYHLFLRLNVYSNAVQFCAAATPVIPDDIPWGCCHGAMTQSVYCEKPCMIMFLMREVAIVGFMDNTVGLLTGKRLRDFSSEILTVQPKCPKCPARKHSHQPIQHVMTNTSYRTLKHLLTVRKVALG